MEVITSINNKTVKDTVKLHQRKNRGNLFLLEGWKNIEEAVSSNIEIKKIFINQENKNLCDKYRDYENVIFTNTAVLKKISTTETPPDIVGIGVQKNYTLSDIQNFKKIILLENIKDAGNLGTIIRTASALNFDAVILFGDTVDPYNPKVIRSAVGNLWKLPIVQTCDFNALKQIFDKYDRIATLPASKDSINLKDYIPKLPVLVMFGSEANGLSENMINFSTKKVTIEMNHNVESLNLSISAAIVIYRFI